MTQRVSTFFKIFFLVGCLAGVSGAKTDLFGGRLSLPDFPGYSVFVQTTDDAKAANLAKGTRWDLSAQPTANATRYLFINPQETVWVAVSIHHTTYGGKESLSNQKFEPEFVSRLAKTGMTLERKDKLRSPKAGDIGYYYLVDSKAKKFATRLLYVPAASTGHYGDNRAFTIGISYTKAGATAAEALTQKIVDGMGVTKK